MDTKKSTILESHGKKLIPKLSKQPRFATVKKYIIVSVTGDNIAYVYFRWWGWAVGCVLIPDNCLTIYFKYALNSLLRIK